MKKNWLRPLLALIITALCIAGYAVGYQFLKGLIQDFPENMAPAMFWLEAWTPIWGAVFGASLLILERWPIGKRARFCVWPLVGFVLCSFSLVAGKIFPVWN